MKGPMWLAWVIFGVMAVISVLLLMGKGSFLIAGYNTASREEKEKFDVKKLCHVVGGGLGIITITMGINLYYGGDNLPQGLQWLMPWGILGPIAGMLVLVNTVCRKR